MHTPPECHTEPHAAAIIADLLRHVWLAADGAPIVQEALDYLATARREHPDQALAEPIADWLDVLGAGASRGSSCGIAACCTAVSAEIAPSRRSAWRI